jgi:hypothetical protein
MPAQSGRLAHAFGGLCGVGDFAGVGRPKQTEDRCEPVAIERRRHGATRSKIASAATLSLA